MCEVVGARAQAAALSMVGRGEALGDDGHRRPRRKRGGGSVFNEETLCVKTEASSTSRTPKRVKTEAKRAEPKAFKDGFEWMKQVREAKTFRPTEEEFANPFAYLCGISEEAQKYGIVKIVPPVQAAVNAAEVLKKFKFSTNVQMLTSAKPSRGAKKFYRSGKEYTLETFEEHANKEARNRFGVSATQTMHRTEKEFWKEMTTGTGRAKGSKTVEYGSDIDGSGFSPNESECPLALSEWNLKKFARSSLSSLAHLKTSIPGVTEPMLYCGMLFSQFAWHVEDNFLNSINYHHFGAPKFWYGVAAKDAKKFDQIAYKHVFKSGKPGEEEIGAEEEHKAAGTFINKTTMFCPKVLVDHGVDVYKIHQLPGEYVLTFPQAYHGGFSTGFNLGEAVNFATREWYSYGLRAEERYRTLRLPPVVSIEELLVADFKKLMEVKGGEDRVPFNMCNIFFEKVKEILSTWNEIVGEVNAEEMIWKGKVGGLWMKKSCMSLHCSKCQCACYLSHFNTTTLTVPLCVHCIRETARRNRESGSQEVIKITLNPVLRKMMAFFSTYRPSEHESEEVKELIAGYKKGAFEAFGVLMDIFEQEMVGKPLTRMTKMRPMVIGRQKTMEAIADQQTSAPKPTSVMM